MDATAASMAHTATALAQLNVNWVHVMMLLVIVLRDVPVASLGHSVKYLVLLTVVHQSVARIRAIVTLDALLVSLVISVMNHVLLTVRAVVTNPVVLVQSVKKVSLVGNVTNPVI